MRLSAVPQRWERLSHITHIKKKKKGAAPDKAPPLSLRFSLAPLRYAFPKQDVLRRGARKVSAPAFPAHAEKRAEKSRRVFPAA